MTTNDNDNGRGTTTADAFAAARDKVGSALGDAREKASTVLHDARDTASDAGGKAYDALASNPLAALVGGLAAGALAAALLPKTAREAQLLGSLGQRLTGAAREAADAARDAGRDKLDELGLTPDRARDTVSKLFADVAKAATHAGTAAAGTVGGTRAN